MKKDENKKRPPIVSVLGHVDHGKTTLLDNIRKSNVQRREAGGMTQSIGASVITTSGKKKITFIDTPGHSAFEKMRSRGANVADIAILVVAADDGVKPQTIEAINHIKKANTPFLVAITKVDSKNANSKTVKDELKREKIEIEENGGDVPVVEVSGVTGKGVPDLLETILLLAEINEIKGDKSGDLEAVVVETGKDKRGPTVSVVVREGVLSVGKAIEVDGKETKVRGLFNDEEKSIKEAISGEPALILGFKEIPEVGSLVVLPGKSKEKQEKQKEKRIEVGEEEIAVVLKAQNAGSLEAVKEGISKKAIVISSEVGDVTENDVFVAKASDASVFVFESKVSSSIKKLATTEGVKIFEFKIIYELFEKVNELLEKKEKKMLGSAKIVATFPFNKKKIAGCKMISGEIKMKDKLTLLRDGKDIGKARVVSMMKQKQEVEEVGLGEEVGFLLSPQLDFEIGDVLVSVTDGQRV